jgi:N-terminal acetyltransferase B complex non-catalytic subunit
MNEINILDKMIKNLYDSIKEKKNLIDFFSVQFNLNKNNKEKEIINNYNNNNNQNINIPINSLNKLLNEFNDTISMSLQAIQILQGEIWDVKQEKFLSKKIENYNNLKNDENIFFELNKNNNNNDNKENECKNNYNFDNKLYFDYNKIEEELEIKKNKKNFEIKKFNDFYNNNKNIISSNIPNYNFDNFDKNSKIISKIPIRQSLRKQIINNNNNNKKNKNLSLSMINDNNKLKNKIENFEKKKKLNKLISNLNNNNSYKTYLINKYANGDYNKFLERLNNNEISIDKIYSEINIITDLLKTETKKNNLYKKNKNEKKIARSNSYIEPINFSNYLRDGDGSNKKIILMKQLN